MSTSYSDLEITELCAKAIGMATNVRPIRGTIMRHWFMDGNVEREYNPLHNDAQAMELVKRFQMDVKRYFRQIEESKSYWEVVATISGWDKTVSEDLNRAICECVAKCHAAKLQSL